MRLPLAAYSTPLMRCRDGSNKMSGIKDFIRADAMSTKPRIAKTRLMDIDGMLSPGRVARRFAAVKRRRFERVLIATLALRGRFLLRPRQGGKCAPVSDVSSQVNDRRI